MEKLNYLADILLKGLLIATSSILFIYLIWLMIHFGTYFVKKILKPNRYIISQYYEQGKMYYTGKNSTWTTDIKKARKYKNEPDFYWISRNFHKIEKLS